jgi:predicted dehydrogenase
MTYRVAVVGAGARDQSERYAMAYRHANAYQRLDECELVACADVVREHAEKFAETFGIPDGSIYDDHAEMVSAVEPDIVSVCTPPKTHAEIVIDCAQSDVVEAIHCEKPMAGTWQECARMVTVCDQRGVQLTINHQRRFAGPYQRAKSMLDDGHIGDLQRIEIGSQDLYDTGTHLFDMCGYMTDQTPVEWVLAQVDCSEPTQKYGLYQETEALARWHHESGVDGLVSTGEEEMVRCHLRLVGSDGMIEVGHEDVPALRVRVDGDGWQTVETGRDDIWRPLPHPLDRIVERIPVGPDRLFSDPTYVDRAIENVVYSLGEGTESKLAAENALQTTEIIFACWESARRGGRVELPLDVNDNPLEAIVEEQSGSRGRAR